MSGGDLPDCANRSNGLPAAPTMRVGRGASGGMRYAPAFDLSRTRTPSATRGPGAATPSIAAVPPGVMDLRRLRRLRRRHNDSGAGSTGSTMGRSDDEGGVVRHPREQDVDPPVSGDTHHQLILWAHFVATPTVRWRGALGSLRSGGGARPVRRAGRHRAPSRLRSMQGSSRAKPCGMISTSKSVIGAWVKFVIGGERVLV